MTKGAGSATTKRGAAGLAAARAAGHGFPPGVSGNPGGRPARSRNRLQGVFLAALADDFERHGAAAIVQCREAKPAEYLKVIAALLPREVEVRRPLEELSDDELNAALGAVRAVLAEQGAGHGRQ